MASYGNSRVRFGMNGSADILGCHRHDGRMIAIEVKKPETMKDVSDTQRTFLETIRRCGGYAGVASSTEDVDAILAAKWSV